MNNLSIPNHTQVPNIIIDELMGKLNGSELKVLLAICRKTIGWHKRTDSISLSQLEKLTGLSRKSITVAIPELEKAALISVDRSDRINKYDLNYDSEVFTPEVVNKSHHSSEKSTPATSENTSHTKETITKETLTKERERSPGARANGEAINGKPALPVEADLKKDGFGRQLAEDLFAGLDRAQNSDELLELWLDYLSYTDKEINNFLVKGTREKIENWDSMLAKAIIKEAITNGHKSLKKGMVM